MGDVIKGGGRGYRPPALPASGGGVVQPGPLAAKLCAEEILNKAEAEAERLVSRAQAELEDARRRGFEQGMREASAEAARLMAAADMEVSRMMAAGEQELVKLAVEVAGRIVQQELEFAPHKIEGMVAHVLRQAAWDRRLVLKVNPADAAVLEKKLAGVENLEIVADQGVSRGGCLVQGKEISIDARLETRLKAIEDILLERDRSQDRGDQNES